MKKEQQRKVKLIIHSGSQNDGSNIAVLEGWYSGRGNLHCLEYAERGEEIKGTMTRILFLSDHASITRQGTINSKMEFYPDTVKGSYYETQYGSVYMEIETRHVAFLSTGTGYEGRIAYKLIFGGDRNNSDERDMKIQVQFCDEDC